MSKFTITVNDAHIERFILNMLGMLKNNPAIQFKKEGNNFLITSTAQENNLMLAGKPMTWEDLVAETEASEKDYENGKYFTTQEIRNDFKNW